MAINCSRCGDIESEADHKPTCPHGIAHFQYQRGLAIGIAQGEASMRELAMIEAMMDVFPNSVNGSQKIVNGAMCALITRIRALPSKPGAT